ncbi:MAG: MATE family efflux transporter [Fusobacteriota bacterium]
MKNENLLRKAKIPKVLFQLALPAIIAMMAYAMYNVIDTIFIGRGVGALGIAGVSIVMPAQILFMGLAQLIGIGATSIFSRKLGERNYDEVNRVAGNTFFSLTLMGIILFIIGVSFPEEIIGLFGATEEIYPYALEYGKVIFLGALYISFPIALNNFLRAEGNAKDAMFSMLIGIVLNCILDYIFIFIFDFGIAGAAYATIISQFASFLYIIWYFKGQKSVVKYKLKYFKLNVRILKETCSIGVSSFARQSASSIIIVILNRSLAIYGGNMSIAVYGIIMKVVLFLIMPMFGLIQGMQAIAGYNYGAKLYDRVIEVVWLSIKISFIIGFVGTGFVQIFPEAIMGIFSDNRELILQGKNAMRIVVAVLPIVGVGITGSVLSQALGKAVPAFIFSLLRQVILFLPLMLILPRLGLGVTGIWLAFPIADLIATFIIGIYLLREEKKMEIQQEKINQ